MPTQPLRRNLLKLRQEEAAKGPVQPSKPAPEAIPAQVVEVQKLQALRDRLKPALRGEIPLGSPLHPRTADLVRKKGRVLVSPPKPHVPYTGLATIKDQAALGGRMRGSKTCKTPEQRAEMLRRIGRKGGLAKARKRKVLIEAMDKLNRRIARERRRLVKAGVPVEVLD